MEQTAIDWLIEQIESCKITIYSDGDRKKLISLVDSNLIEQAKQMEKQQIIDAKDCWLEDERDGDEYYEQNFK